MIRAVLDPLRKSLSPRVSVTMHHPRAVGFWKHCVWIAAVTIVRTHCSSADNLMNIIKDNGYPVEHHTVITEDNYVLGLHRIPPKKEATKTVLVMHGLVNSGVDFAMFGPQYSLGYYLADASYDVWLANARGTQFSRNHTLLDANTSAAYWDFSFEEIGRYDLPAIIDYILAATNSRALHYIGHSQGCTSFFIMLDYRPEYNAKVTSMHALAPAVFIGESSLVPRPIVNGAEEIQSALASMQIYDLSLASQPVRANLHPLIEPFCKANSWMQAFCVNGLFVLLGSNTPPMTPKLASIFVQNTPAGVSSKQLVHFAQFIRSGNFQRFDYGPERNREVYDGPDAPPAYNLSATEVPIYGIYGAMDFITPEGGVKQTFEQLGNNMRSVQRIPNFNHLDFVYSRYAKKLVYRDILKNLRKHKT